MLRQPDALEWLIVELDLRMPKFGAGDSRAGYIDADHVRPAG
jgi:hypothetical protein